MNAAHQSRPLRALVADDEAPARRRLLRMLAAAGGVEVVAEAADGTAAAALLASLPLDFAFLDISMPGRTGLELAAARLLNPPQFIFVTAHAGYAVDAFALHACDYLLKPFDQPRLLDVLAHARARLAATPRRLAVDTGDRTVIIRVEDIAWIAAAGNYVELHLEGGATLLTRATLLSLTRELDPAAFLRLNRSTLVRAAAIAETHPGRHGDCRVRLHDGTELSWSRRYRGADPLIPGLLPLVPK